jgi:uncharacterized protein (TIGR00661 family)
MKFVFIIQGEGRGHLTQALSLYRLLTQNGHQVAAVLIGKSARRVVPAFVYEQLHPVPVHLFESPNFITDAKDKGINIWPTLTYNLSRQSVYFDSLRSIDKWLEAEKPDAVVNFYDLLGGMYYLFYRKKCRYFIVGHQYFLEHSSFHFPPGSQRYLLKLNNCLSALSADAKLALSFRDLPDEPERNIHVVPPLLRKEVLDLKPEKGKHLLLYINTVGYSQEIQDWHKGHPDIECHCFWDKKDMPQEWQAHPNLTFHQINDYKFLEYMRTCQGYVSTAGFESICEAMYLGKPVMMIPIHNQYEQACNALDAVQAGAGIQADRFELNTFLDYLPTHEDKQEVFRDWVKQAEERFLKVLLS